MNKLLYSLTIIVSCFFLVGFINPLGVLHLPPIKKAETGFKRPIVSITFDDGWESNYIHALPQLKKYGYHATFYLNTGALNQPDRFTDAQVLELKKSGHEIGAHTVTHPHLNEISAADVEKELTQSKATLEKITGAPVNDFAAPFGDVSPSVIAQIKKYFQSNRGVINGYNSPIEFDPYDIKVQNIKNTVTPQQVEEWLDKNAADKTWLVLVYHQIDNNGATWSTTPEGIEKHIAAINKRNLTVLTVEQALQEITPQLSKMQNK